MKTKDPISNIMFGAVFSFILLLGIVHLVRWLTNVHISITAFSIGCLVGIIIVSYCVYRRQKRKENNKNLSSACRDQLRLISKK